MRYFSSELQKCANPWKQLKIFPHRKNHFFCKSLEILVIKTNLLHAKNIKIYFYHRWSEIWWFFGGDPIKIRCHSRILPQNLDAEIFKSLYFCPRWAKINFNIFCVQQICFYNQDSKGFTKNRFFRYEKIFTTISTGSPKW